MSNLRLFILVLTVSVCVLVHQSNLADACIGNGGGPSSSTLKRILDMCETSGSNGNGNNNNNTNNGKIKAEDCVKIIKSLYGST